MSEVFEASRPDLIERLARIEGQGNFLSALVGNEVAADTTEDMGALGFARSRGAIPEVLEAHVAQTEMFKLPLMSLTWRVIVDGLLNDCRNLSQKEKCLEKINLNRPWMQGAIADAFLMIRSGQQKNPTRRAKSFGVGLNAYAAVRKTAHGILATWLGDATRGFKRAKRTAGEISTNRHTDSGWGDKYVLAPGCFAAPALPDSDSVADDYQYHGIAVGMADRLGWDPRREREPGPCITIEGEAAARHIASFPSQPRGTGTAYDQDF